MDGLTTRVVLLFLLHICILFYSLNYHVLYFIYCSFYCLSSTISLDVSSFYVSYYLPESYITSELLCVAASFSNLLMHTHHLLTAEHKDLLPHDDFHPWTLSRLLFLLSLYPSSSSPLWMGGRAPGPHSALCCCVSGCFLVQEMDGSFLYLHTCFSVV